MPKKVTVICFVIFAQERICLKVLPEYILLFLAVFHSFTSVLICQLYENPFVA